MIIDVPLDGPFQSYGLFKDFSKLINSDISPTSIGGNNLYSKYYDIFKNLVSKERLIVENLYDNCNIKLLDGCFFVILLKHDVDRSCRSYYYLSNVKVNLRMYQNGSFYTVTPLESHSITSNTLDDLSCKYESFKKYRGNGFKENFYGKLRFDLGEDSEKISEIISLYTFKNDLKTMSLSNDLDTLLHVIWSSIGFIPYHELSLLNCESTIKMREKYFMPSICIELSGIVYDYIKSDVMVLPDPIKSLKYRKIEEDSDFSDYSESDDNEESFDFSSKEFLNFFNLVSESIKKLGGSVIPYVKGSYLQDGSWMTNNSTICKDLRDVILLLKGSTRWQDEFSSKEKLILYRVPSSGQSIQFRVFVYDLRVIIISQLFFNQVYDYLLKGEELIKLFYRIKNFYKKAQSFFPKGVVNLVIDLYIMTNSEDIFITNFTTWNINQENLFTWEDIYEFATSGKKIQHDKTVKVTYLEKVAIAILLSKNLSRHKLYSFCSQDVEEQYKLDLQFIFSLNRYF